MDLVGKAYKSRGINTNINLDSLSREELVEKVKALQAHNAQLKNVIAKFNNGKPKKHKKKQRPFDFERCKMRHVLLKFLYLGWDHHGYAVQEDSMNTIECYLFDALMKTCLIKDRTCSNYHRCGRTDKGVSSFGQVISIDLRSKHNDVTQELDYCALLNKVLPSTIQCIAWCPVGEEFSARFDCKGRTYKYYFPKSTLNINNMQEAGDYLVGTHDFRNFCKMDVGNGVVKYIRSIISIDISSYSVNKNEEYSMYVLTIEAPAFLWHQIRCIMGVLFIIGQGNESPEIIKELLNIEKNPRKPDYNLASEIPLNLFHCDYDLENDWIYNMESLNLVVLKLQNIWTVTTAKSTMIENMLEELHQIQQMQCSGTFINCLLNGVKAKRYIPLLQRQTCESLENRIQHYVKRRKLEKQPNYKDTTNS